MMIHIGATPQGGYFHPSQNDRLKMTEKGNGSPSGKRKRNDVHHDALSPIMQKERSSTHRCNG